MSEMKVKDLISILKEMDQNMPVWYATDSYDGWYVLTPMGVRKESIELDGKEYPICLIGEAQ